MDRITITASPREVFGKKLAASRNAGKLPAVIYGQEADNESIFVNAHDFTKVYSTAGHNTIVDVKVDQNKPSNVLIQAVEHHPVTGELIHADLYRVNMTQAIRTTVPLHFTGDAPAVYQQEDTLLTNIEEVEVETLPSKLPANIEVDITGLTDFDTAIHIRDLNIPEGVEIFVDGDELVCKVEPPRSQEEIEALDEDIVEEIPAEEGEEGTEAAEGAEGEAKAEGSEAAAEDKKE